MQHKVTLRKSNTKVYAYGSDTPLKVKGQQFQAEIESKKQYEVAQIHVANGSGGNLLSAKTAQDLGLIQLVNKITTLPKQAPETQAQRQVCNTSPVNYQLPVNDNTLPPPAQQQVEHLQFSMPTSPDPDIHEILQKYTTVFEGQGNSKITRLNFTLMKMSNPLSNPSVDYHTTFAKKFLRN